MKASGRFLTALGVVAAVGVAAAAQLGGDRIDSHVAIARVRESRTIGVAVGPAEEPVRKHDVLPQRSPRILRGDL
jgi:hypothetical protein